MCRAVTDGWLRSGNMPQLRRIHVTILETDNASDPTQTNPFKITGTGCTLIFHPETLHLPDLHWVASCHLKH